MSKISKLLETSNNPQDSLSEVIDYEQTIASRSPSERPIYGMGMNLGYALNRWINSTDNSKPNKNSLDIFFQGFFKTIGNDMNSEDFKNLGKFLKDGFLTNHSETFKGKFGDE